MRGRLSYVAAPPNFYFVVCFLIASDSPEHVGGSVACASRSSVRYGPSWFTKHCSTSALVTLCFVASFCRILGEMIRLMDEHYLEGVSERQGGVYIRLRADRKTLHSSRCRMQVLRVWSRDMSLRRTIMTGGAVQA